MSLAIDSVARFGEVVAAIAIVDRGRVADVPGAVVSAQREDDVELKMPGDCDPTTILRATRVAR